MSRKIDAMRLGASRVRAGVVVLAAATAVLCALAGVAFGQAGGGTTATAADGTTSTTTTTTTGGTTSSDNATATASGGSGSLSLVAEAAHPGKAFSYGDNRITYTFTLDGDRSKDLKIQAVKRENWKTVKVWRRDNVKPGTHKVRWGGITNKHRAASKGVYLFRIRTVRDRDLDRSRSKGDDRSVNVYPAKFPIRAPHTYGDGYGAPRSGHVHQGQDILAKCGKPVVAARGGRVQYRSYQAGGAGNYVVIDARADSHDYVYMHLKHRGPKKGTRMHTGEKIGRVGRTGDASACHLHFEIWSRPGWYEGGDAMSSVTRKLKKWDQWS